MSDYISMFSIVLITLNDNQLGSSIVLEKQFVLGFNYFLLIIINKSQKSFK